MAYASRDAAHIVICAADNATVGAVGDGNKALPPCDAAHPYVAADSATVGAVGDRTEVLSYDATHIFIFAADSAVVGTIGDNCIGCTMTHNTTHVFTATADSTVVGAARNGTYVVANYAAYTLTAVDVGIHTRGHVAVFYRTF